MTPSHLLLLLIGFFTSASVAWISWAAGFALYYIPWTILAFAYGFFFFEELYFLYQQGHDYDDER